MQGFSFCPANNEFYSLRKRAKIALSPLYLMGNFYSTLVKITVCMLGVIICYILMLDSHVGLFQKIPNLFAPLIVHLRLFRSFS